LKQKGDTDGEDGIDDVEEDKPGKWQDECWDGIKH